MPDGPSPAAASSGWIDARARRPPSGQFVLYHDGRHRRVWLGQLGSETYSDGRPPEYYVIPTNGGPCIDWGRVTHWMPLPEGPGSRRGDEDR